MFPADVQIIWDLEDNPSGNYWHIVIENGVTKEEFEEVFFDNPENTAVSRSSGRPMTFGWTSTGRFLAVIWEHLQDNPLTIYPVTAFDVEPK